MGREEGFPWYHPNFPRTRRLRLAGHFVPTNISLPRNAGTAARTSCGARCHLALRSPLQLERELRLVSVERGSQPVPRASLTTFASLLSSVITFYGVACWPLLSAKYWQCQGRAAACNISTLTAYPAIARGAAKDQLRGRREFSTKQACCVAHSVYKGR